MMNDVNKIQTWEGAGESVIEMVEIKANKRLEFTSVQVYSTGVQVNSLH